MCFYIEIIHNIAQTPHKIPPRESGRLKQKRWNSLFVFIKPLLDIYEETDKSI